MSKIFEDVNNWFKINQPVLNLKTHYLQFNTKNNRDCDLKLNHQGTNIASSSTTKFLGLTIDDTLLWKAHIDQVMPKLNIACFILRTVHGVMSLEALRVVYFACLRSIMSCGIIFWGNQPYSEKLFKIQKKAIRIITNSRPRDSCRELFKRLEILPLYSQYIFSISTFVVKNRHLFSTNNQIHTIHTRHKNNLHPPITDVTKFQKGVFYSGIKIFNNLPPNIKSLANKTTQFQNALKTFLLINSFYNSEEYCNYQKWFLLVN